MSKLNEHASTDPNESQPLPDGIAAELAHWLRQLGHESSHPLEVRHDEVHEGLMFDLDAMPEPLPEPGEVAGTRLLEVQGRHVTPVLSMDSPRVLVVDGLLAEAECLALIDHAQSPPSAEATPAEDFDLQSWQGVAMVSAVDSRLAALCHWPEEDTEALTVLRVGADGYTTPPEAGTQDGCDQGTDQASDAVVRKVVGMAVVYLNAARSGGALSLHAHPLVITPRQGRLVFLRSEGRHDAEPGWSMVSCESDTQWVLVKRYWAQQVAVEDAAAGTPSGSQPRDSLS